MLAISGILAYLEGDYVLARTYSEQSLRMFRELQAAPTAAAMNLDNLGSIARRVQSGYLYSYAFWMMIGLAMLLGWFLAHA